MNEKQERLVKTKVIFLLFLTMIESDRHFIAIVPSSAAFKSQ